MLSEKEVRSLFNDIIDTAHEFLYEKRFRDAHEYMMFAICSGIILDPRKEDKEIVELVDDLRRRYYDLTTTG